MQTELYCNACISAVCIWKLSILLQTSFLFFLIYFERERMGGGRGRERERERERIPSRLHAVSTEPNAGLKLTDREITN